MAKFFGGLVAGILLALGYVQWNVSLPAVLLLPDVLRGNLISTAVEDRLYDIDGDRSRQMRALEVFFANRAAFAAQVDAEAGHPFVEALRKRRATREARQLSMAWAANEAALGKAALLAVLERKHATSDRALLLQRMLVEGLDRKPFLKAWLVKNRHPIDEAGLRATLDRVSVLAGR
jgi:hypothetical protein